MSVFSIQHRAVSLPARLAANIQRFRAERDGSISVEGAVFISLLSLGAAQMITIKAATDMKSRLSDSLHLSSQYIVQGGSNLERLEALFELNYGAKPASMTKSLLCAVPPTLMEDGSLDTSEETLELYKKQGVRSYANVQNSDGSWADCSATHPMRFLDIQVTDDAPKIFSKERMDVTSRLRIKI